MDLSAYLDFIKHTAPSGYRKSVDRSCLGLLLWVALSLLAAPYLGLGVDLYAQIPSVVLIGLIYLTKLPLFSLLLAAYGGVSVFSSLLHTGEFVGYGLLAVGLTCFFTTRRLRAAFRSYEQTGRFELPETPAVIVGSGKTSQETFTARGACPHCGAAGLRVTATKYSRFALRYSNHSADWETSCPACGKTTAIKSAQAKKLALESGEFPLYRRAEFVDWWLVALIISAAAALIGLAASLILLRSHAVVYADDVRSPSMSTGRQLIVENAQIIDCFAVGAGEEFWDGDWSDTEAIQAVYVTVFFENDAGAWLLPVKVLPDKDIFATCCAFGADLAAEPIPLGVHGYIDRLPLDLVPLFRENVQGWQRAGASVEGLSGMVIYWDGETAPSDDMAAERVFQLMAAVGALLAALFYCLDRTVNSEEHALRVQARYDAKRG